MPRGVTRSARGRLPKAKPCTVNLGKGFSLQRKFLRIKDTRGILTLKAQNCGYTIEDKILIPTKITTRSGKTHHTFIIKRGMNSNQGNTNLNSTSTSSTSTEIPTKPFRKKQFAKKSTGGANQALKHLLVKEKTQNGTPPEIGTHKETKTDIQPQNDDVTSPPTKKQKTYQEQQNSSEENLTDNNNCSKSLTTKNQQQNGESRPKKKRSLENLNSSPNPTDNVSKMPPTSISKHPNENSLQSKCECNDPSSKETARHYPKRRNRAEVVERAVLCEKICLKNAPSIDDSEVDEGRKALAVHNLNITTHDSKEQQISKIVNEIESQKSICRKRDPLPIKSETEKVTEETYDTKLPMDVKLNLIEKSLKHLQSTQHNSKEDYSFTKQDQNPTKNGVASKESEISKQVEKVEDEKIFKSEKDSTEVKDVVQTKLGGVDVGEKEEVLNKEDDKNFLQETKRETGTVESITYLKDSSSDIKMKDSCDHEGESDAPSESPLDKLIKENELSLEKNNDLQDDEKPRAITPSFGASPHLKTSVSRKRHRSASPGVKDPNAFKSKDNKSSGLSKIKFSSKDIPVKPKFASEKLRNMKNVMKSVMSQRKDQQQTTKGMKKADEDKIDGTVTKKDVSGTPTKATPKKEEGIAKLMKDIKLAMGSSAKNGSAESVTSDEVDTHSDMKKKILLDNGNLKASGQKESCPTDMQSALDVEMVSSDDDFDDENEIPSNTGRSEDPSVKCIQIDGHKNENKSVLPEKADNSGNTSLREKSDNSKDSPPSFPDSFVVVDEVGYSFDTEESSQSAVSEKQLESNNSHTSSPKVKFDKDNAKMQEGNSGKDPKTTITSYSILSECTEPPQADNATVEISKQVSSDSTDSKVIIVTDNKTNYNLSKVDNSSDYLVPVVQVKEIQSLSNGKGKTANSSVVGKEEIANSSVGGKGETANSNVDVKEDLKKDIIDVKLIGPTKRPQSPPSDPKAESKRSKVDGNVDKVSEGQQCLNDKEIAHRTSVDISRAEMVDQNVTTQSSETQTSNNVAVISIEEVNRIIKALLDSEYHQKEQLKRALAETIMQRNQLKEVAKEFKAQLENAQEKLAKNQDTVNVSTNTSTDAGGSPMFPIIIQSIGCQTEKIPLPKENIIESIDLTKHPASTHLAPETTTPAPSTPSEKGKVISSLLAKNRDNIRATVQSAFQANQPSSALKLAVTPPATTPGNSVTHTSGEGTSVSSNHLFSTMPKPSGTFLKQNSAPANVARTMTPMRVSSTPVHTGHSGTPPAKQSTLPPSTPPKLIADDVTIIDLTGTEELQRRKLNNLCGQNFRNQLNASQTSPAKSTTLPKVISPTKPVNTMQVNNVPHKQQHPSLPQRLPQRPATRELSVSTALGSHVGNVTSNLQLQAQRVNIPQNTRTIQSNMVQNPPIQQYQTVQQQLPVSQQMIVSRPPSGTITSVAGQSIILNSNGQQQFIQQSMPPMQPITTQGSLAILQQMAGASSQIQQQKSQQLAFLLQQQQPPNNLIRGGLPSYNNALQNAAAYPRASATAAAIVSQARHMTQAEQQRFPNLQTTANYNYPNLQIPNLNVNAARANINASQVSVSNGPLLNVPNVPRRTNVSENGRQTISQVINHSANQQVSWKAQTQRSEVEMPLRDVLTSLNAKLIELQQKKRAHMQHLQLLYARGMHQEAQNASRTHETLLTNINTVQRKIEETKSKLVLYPSTAVNAAQVVGNHVPEGNKVHPPVMLQQVQALTRSPQVNQPMNVQQQRTSTNEAPPPNRTILAAQLQDRAAATQRSGATYQSGRVWMPPKSPQNVQSTSPRGTSVSSHPAPLPILPGSNDVAPGSLLPAQPSIRITHNSEGVVLSWNINPTDANSTVKKYHLYAYQVLNAPPNTTHWKKIGDVEALPPPMACTLNQFQPGSTYHLAICAVDVYGRVGPFSETEEVHIPLDRTTA